MAEFFEALMVVSFGISWPMSIIKSYRSKSNRGKSLIFLLFILFGYGCGIASKLMKDNLTYVFIFYVLNFVMVSIDLCLFFRNRRIEKSKADF